MASKTFISDDMQQQVEELARDQKREPAEVVEEALARYIAIQRLKDTFAFGESHTRKLGIRAEDVDRIVREERDESKIRR